MYSLTQATKASNVTGQEYELNLLSMHCTRVAHATTLIVVNSQHPDIIEVNQK